MDEEKPHDGLSILVRDARVDIGAPAETIFSPGVLAGEDRVTWGSLRANKDEDYRLRALSARLRTFLLKQTSNIIDKKIDAPFPLTTVTLVGIGSLGEIFYGDAAHPRDKYRNLILFCCFCNSLDQRFPRAPKKEFKAAFAKRWSEEKPCSTSQILYTFFRNSFVHGYYGRSVFLTGDETQDFTLREDGCVLLNPDWFYEVFRKSAEKHLVDMAAEQMNGRFRKNALKYIRKLIDDHD